MSKTERIGKNLTHVRVNELLQENKDWFAVEVGRNGIYNGQLDRGFELVQGEMVDGEIVSTTDSLPVSEVRAIGNQILFTLLGGTKISLDDIIGEKPLEKAA